MSALGLRAWPFLLWRGSQLLRREKFDLVFFSTSQFITYSLGRLWKARYGVPYVIDVQDPWRTDYYSSPGAPPPPGGWKFQFARFQAWALERWIFAGSAAVMSVSPRLLQDLVACYPGLAAKPSAVLGFGASPIDLEKALELPGPAAGFSRDGGEVHLLATGAAGGIMAPALTALFEGLSSYRRRDPERARRLRLHFVGTSYAHAGRGRPSVMPVAARHGVADLVEETPHRTGFLQALRLQQEADALLLLGSNDPAYSPSKIYFYYLAGRPILAVVFKGSVMERLLDELAGAAVVRLSAEEPAPRSEETLHGFFDQLLAGKSSEANPRWNDAIFRSRYLAESLTRRQCALFESALAAGPPGTSS